MFDILGQLELFLDVTKKHTTQTLLSKKGLYYLPYSYISIASAALRAQTMQGLVSLYLSVLSY